MFFVWNFKNINWEHVEFDEGKSHFLPFFVVYHNLRETEICPFVRLLLAWIVQRCNISCIGILKRVLFRSSNKSELPWKMKRIWSKDWTKLGSNRCMQIGHDDILLFFSFVGRNIVKDEIHGFKVIGLTTNFNSSLKVCNQKSEKHNINSI